MNKVIVFYLCIALIGGTVAGLIDVILPPSETVICESPQASKTTDNETKPPLYSIGFNYMESRA